MGKGQQEKGTCDVMVGFYNPFSCSLLNVIYVFVMRGTYSCRSICHTCSLLDNMSWNCLNRLEDLIWVRKVDGEKAPVITLKENSHCLLLIEKTSWFKPTNLTESASIKQYLAD